MIIDRPHNPKHGGEFVLTDHALDRKDGRSLSDAVIPVLTYGRVSHVRLSKVYVIGKKEVKRYADYVDLRPYRGVHVLVHPKTNIVLTVYRNRDLQLTEKGWGSKSKRRG